ncbi:MAG: PD40 domain-containing protein [Bacteroidetes bacterium]|nr:PD40 domain-containing protein [Bacteroidota bacterium]
MKKIYFVFSLIVFVATNSFSQFNEVFEKKYNLANNLVNKSNFQDALPIFLKLDSMAPQNSNINFYIGLCYINSFDNKAQAIPFLEIASKNVSNESMGDYFETTSPVYSLYYLGKAYHIDNKLNLAIETYNTYKNYLKPDQKDLIKDVDRQIEMCYNAKKLEANPLKIKIDNLGDSLNSKYPEYSPVVAIDESTLIFTSRRPGSTGGQKDGDGKYFEDIYIANFNTAENKYFNVRNIGININTDGHEASASLSVDGKQLFIYRDDNGDGNIYVSNLINGEWSKPTKLPEPINTKSKETHACLSPDGNTLYFTSDRKGGLGGMDIYSSEKKANGAWSLPVNLGKSVNSIYDEDAPFMHTDGVTLYFSSQGHESMGGFDIFTSTLAENGLWSSADNIGSPINTTDDDIFYFPSADQKHAYYSSSTLSGIGDQDIYKITILGEKKKVAALKGLIVDAETNAPLVGKMLVVDIAKSDTIAILSSEDLSGEYYLTLPTGKKFNLIVSNEKYEIYYDTIDIKPSTEDQLIIKQIALKKLLDVKYKFNGESIGIGDIVLMKNVIFVKNKPNLNPTSEPEIAMLADLMKANPTLKIEIDAYIDKIGSPQFNKKLSESMAETVKQSLVSKGVDEKLISIKGFGSDFAITINRNEQTRLKNNKIEFKILTNK